MRALTMSALLLAVGVVLVHTDGSAQAPSPPILLPAASQCSDGIDNDGDGKIDFPKDGLPYSGSGDDGCMDPSDDDERAGLPAGTQLRSCSRTLSSGTYDGCDFAGDITIAGENVVIKNSRIRGRIYNSRASTVVMDTDITGPAGGNVSGLDGSPRSGTYRRVRCVGFSTCFYTSNDLLVEDSAIYDVYNTQQDCHTENILLSGRGNAIFRRNWIHANWYQGRSCPNGGFSATIAIYSHDSFWADAHNKVFEGNRIGMERNLAYFHMYGGNACDGGGTNPTGMVLRDNIFVGDPLGSSSMPAIWGWRRHSSNVWSGNKRATALATSYEAASAWSEPNTDCY